MAYLEEFQKQINNRNSNKLFQLWEEYCTNDTVNAPELIQILTVIKESDFASLFGPFAETALPLWGMVSDKEDSYGVLKLILDIQTTNSKELAEIAINTLKERYKEDPHFKERLRLIGLRTKLNFQGCLASYDLLDHFKVGNCVFHTGGWGTGEIMEVSPLREQVAIEFENVPGLRHFTFKNAFNNLRPLPSDHFLSLRFTNPDKLEKEAKKDPVGIMQKFLHDLGPKNAQEIKDELFELVIPEKEWVKWWQNTRSRLKKDTLIQAPKSIKAPFKLRKEEQSHEERLNIAIQNSDSPAHVIQTSYSFVRDLPSILKNKETKEELKNKLTDLLSHEELTKDQELQIYIFLESMFEEKKPGEAIEEFIRSLENIESVIEKMEIVSFKKRALKLVKESRSDWAKIFIGLLYTLKQKPLRDYLLDALTDDALPLLEQELYKLKDHPLEHPELLAWYFRVIVKDGNEKYPYSDSQGECLFFEAFLILLSSIEDEPEHRELVKKMVVLITQKRFELVRKLFKSASLEFVEEFLLLFAKCHCFSNQDKKILHSLAEVAHPSLKTGEREAVSEENILWSTEEGYNKTKAIMERISTTEMVENAREIEEARALGDLRENAEFKAAKEKRSRLQSELKMLSTQINQARILTKNDVTPNVAGVGTIVSIHTPKGENVTYTILGPWETNPEMYIISHQSKLAQAMKGTKTGETFIFRDEEYRIDNVKSYFE
ncbi:MAG: GreA/GreB family elongation factor [Waddliaceae bacterium]